MENLSSSPIANNASDYGSELDDATALELLSQVESQPLKGLVLEDIEEPAIPEDKDEPLHDRIALRLSRLQQSFEGAPESSERIERSAREASVEVECDENNRTSFSRESRHPSQRR